MLVIFLLSLAFAWDKSVGLNITTMAVRSSAGYHRPHSGFGGWVQYCRSQSQIQHCWQGIVDGTFNNQLIPQKQMRTSLVRASGGYGILLGVESTKIGFTIGPSLQFLQGGTDSSVFLLKPGALAQISIQKPLSDDWLLMIGNGYTLRAWGVDPDLVVGLGRRW